MGSMKKLLGLFMKLPFVAKIFKGIGDAIKEAKEMIDAFLAPFIKIYEIIQKVGEFLGYGGGGGGEEGRALPEGTAPKSRGFTNISSASNRTTNNSPSITINTSREISAKGAREFSTEMGAQIMGQSQAGG